MDKKLFAERLHNVCSLRGISALELSRRTGITTERFKQLQDGTSAPTGFELVGIAKILNVHSGWLAGSDDLKENICQKPKGSAQVLGFITEFLEHQRDPEAYNALQVQFRSDYCYHFALMLKGLFGRGQVVWLAPYEQIGWRDAYGVVYTVSGVYQDDGELIPVNWLGDAIKDFAHIPGEFFGTSRDYVQKVIQNYHNRLGNPVPEPGEGLFQIGRSVYLHIQTSDEGWDYTLYGVKDYHLIDGGQLDQPELSLQEAAKQIAAAHGMARKVIRQVPIVLLDAIQEAN